VAKANLGAKRICPQTGKKFYDLNKDPIVSPFTGMEYPLSCFEEGAVVPDAAPGKDIGPGTEDDAEENSREDETENDDSMLDEEPIEIGSEDDDDDSPPVRTVSTEENLEGFSEDEDEDEDVLLDSDGKDDDDDPDLDSEGEK